MGLFCQNRDLFLDDVLDLGVSLLLEVFFYSSVRLYCRHRCVEPLYGASVATNYTVR